MKTIRSRTLRPMRLALGDGKVLHLGFGKTGQISDDALRRPVLRELLASGKIEIVGASGSDVFVGGTPTSPPAETHGHHPPTVVMPKGNR